MDFTYKREFDNQRTGMLTAFEIIDSLKESVKKADANNIDFNRVDVRNPSFGANILEESNPNNNNNNNNPNNMNLTYDQQIVQTEKDDFQSNNNNINQKSSNKLSSSSQKKSNNDLINKKNPVSNFNHEIDMIKNIHTIRKDNANNLLYKENNTIVNTTIETGEDNIVNMNNTFDYNNNSNNNNNNNYVNGNYKIKNNKDASPFKNSKSTTNKKNIQINIHDNINQFSLAQDKLMNINLYSNKANINKNFNINNSTNMNDNYRNMNNNNAIYESDKKIYNSKPKFQNSINNIKSPMSSQKDIYNKISVSNSKNCYASSNNINNKQFNNAENFQDTVKNIKNSIMTGIGSNNSFVGRATDNKKNQETSTGRIFNNVNNKSNSKVKNLLI